MDSVDAGIAKRVQESISARSTPGIGDYVLCSDGLVRICYVWDTHVQTISFGAGSYYLDGLSASYCGAMRGGPALSELTLARQTHVGPYWFYHHGRRLNLNGVSARCAFNVWLFAGTTAQCLGQYPTEKAS